MTASPTSGLERRRNGWCLSYRGEPDHARCPVTWGYYGSSIHVYACDCPCHVTPEDRGQLW